jgi:hypothetical protein
MADCTNGQDDDRSIQPCCLFRDDDMAWFLHQEKHLIAFNGDTDILLDRYDARNLLSDRRQFRQLKKKKPLTDDEMEIKEKIDALRFRDYYHIEHASDDDDDDDDDREEPRTISSRIQPQFAYDYSNEVEAASKRLVNDRAFVPTFFVPEDIEMVII